MQCCLAGHRALGMPDFLFWDDNIPTSGRQILEKLVHRPKGGLPVVSDLSWSDGYRALKTTEALFWGCHVIERPPKDKTLDLNFFAQLEKELPIAMLPRRASGTGHARFSFLG